MNNSSPTSPFNSPLETGIRSLVILVAAHPQALDLQRLVEMDYLTVHSADASGPKSLHTPIPMRAGELLIRRKLIEDGLLLMCSRKLIDRLTDSSGINYIASETAAPFINNLKSTYIIKLMDRAKWTIEEFGELDSTEIRAITNSFFQRWYSQFQPVDSDR
tara:strand:- start:2735 stop:3217 length:483 start_codon:yes stop_codon:yes gene_type:complete